MKSNHNTFFESELNVLFHADWHVIKLDEHRYYRRISGMGLKGVDFIAYTPEFGMVLIEIKNYQQSNVPKSVNAIMENKCNDTLRLIRIIHAYYQRQWSYRLIHWMGLIDFFSKEWSIWTKLYYAATKKRYFFLGIVDS